MNREQKERRQKRKQAKRKQIKRIQPLLSIVLSICMILTGITLEKRTAQAAEYDTSSFTKKEDDVYKPYYQPSTASTSTKTYTAADSVNFSNANDNKITLEKEGSNETCSLTNSKFTFPDDTWIVSGISNTSSNTSISIVKSTAEPQVYLATNAMDANDNYIFANTTLGDAGPNDGMAKVMLSEAQAGLSSDNLAEAKEFYENLNIRVTKMVNKLNANCFKISITWTNNETNQTTDLSSLFDYYCSVDINTPANKAKYKWSSDYLAVGNSSTSTGTKALGGILSDDVRIYIVPTKVLLVKASVDGGKGGSISPAIGYYDLSLDATSSPQTWTMTAAEGYKITRLEKYKANGNLADTFYSTTPTWTYNSSSQATVSADPGQDFDFLDTQNLNIGSFIAYFESCTTTIENKDYENTYTYNGTAISAPTKENFTIKRGDSTSTEGNPTFTWYKGDYTSGGTIDDSKKLNGEPSEVGTYTLQVDVPEDTTNVYDAGSARFLITIQEAASSSGGTTPGTTPSTTPGETGENSNPTVKEPTKEPSKEPTEEPTEEPTDAPTSEVTAAYVNLSIDWQDGKIKLNWDSVAGADGFEIYASPSGKKLHAKALNKTVGSHRSFAVLKKIYGAKISDAAVYRIQVKAFRLVDGKKVTLLKSPVVKIAGEKHTKYTNVKRIRPKKTSITLNPQETARIKCKLIKENKTKKLLDSSLCYASSDKTVATVTKKGKIKAVKSGSCTITVIAANGVKTSVDVSVN